jgi:DNA gyrase subunit A
MFFTNTGRVYVERVHEIPDMGRAAKGRSIANLLELKSGETIAALIRVLAKTGPNNEDITWEQPGFVFFATRLGTVKKTPLEDFANVRKGGIIAISIDSGDTLIDAKLTSGQDEVVLITKEGMSIRFSESDVRAMGRPATGVRGITLEKEDAVVALAIVDPRATLLVAGDQGIGKRTSFEEYRVQSRAGKGIITMKRNERTGGVIGALTVKDEDELMLITVAGQMVRIAVKDVREAGRNTQGVKLIELSHGDRLQAIAPVISEANEAAAEGGENLPGLGSQPTPPEPPPAPTG